MDTHNRVGVHLWYLWGDSWLFDHGDPFSYIVPLYWAEFQAEVDDRVCYPLVPSGGIPEGAGYPDGGCADSSCRAQGQALDNCALLMSGCLDAGLSTIVSNIKAKGSAP